VAYLEIGQGVDIKRWSE